MYVYEMFSRLALVESHFGAREALVACGKKQKIAITIQY